MITSSATDLSAELDATGHGAELDGKICGGYPLSYTASIFNLCVFSLSLSLTTVRLYSMMQRRLFSPPTPWLSLRSILSG